MLGIGLRTVRLRTRDDALVTVPNHRFLQGAVRCENHGSVRIAVTLDLLIGVDQEIARARRILYEAALTSRFLSPSDAVEVLIEQAQEASLVAIRLRLRAHVLEARYREPFTSDVSERTLQAFREQSILPPALLHRSI